jgi:WD40 repeat protein/serine/threonine protein kinase
MEPHEAMLEKLFQAATRLPAGPERMAFLDEAGAGNPGLRERLEELLQAHETPNGFLSAGALPGIARRSVEMPIPARIDRYDVLEKLGEGGFGIVYRAQQREPVQRVVALKVIKPGMDSRPVVARFEAERQALALMDHPSIAKVFDAGSTREGGPFFVMELVPGRRITDYCDREQLSLARRIELFIQVCRAVQHAHQKGIIHRDLKPSNILVTVTDGEAIPKVIDFGIAKAVLPMAPGDAALTRGDQLMGTPAYMSPEQAALRASEVDTRSDIYSLGVVLYELVTGHTPFDVRALSAAGPDELRRAIVERDPPRPSTRLGQLPADAGEVVAQRRQAAPAQLRRQVSGDLDAIISKCLEKARGRRYDTANGLAMDLRRHLNQEPIMARPPSDLDRLQRLVRRHRLAFAAAGAVAAALVIGLGLSTWLWGRERAARWNSVQAEHTAQAALRRSEVAVAEAKATLAKADFLHARQLVEERNNADALAYLARSVAENPTNTAPGIRLLTLLAYNSWLQGLQRVEFASAVTDVQFSPDGTALAVGLGEGTVEILNGQTGRRKAGPFPHESGVIATVFSPDGKRLLTTSWDRSVRIWEVASGEPVGQPLKHDAVALRASFSPDGEQVAIGTADGCAWVQSVATGEVVCGPLKHAASVLDVQFSPDGRDLATASEDSTAMLWNLRSGQRRLGPLRHDSWVNAVRFSPDGRRLATASADHSARLWEVQSGREITPPLRHKHAIVSVQFSGDGTRVLTASTDGTARVWEAATGRAATPPLPHNGPVVNAEFSADGARVVTASSDRSAQLWDARTGERLAEPMRLAAPLKVAHFSPAGDRVVTAAARTVRWWGEPRIAALPLRVRSGVFTKTASFSPDGSRLAVGGADGVAQVYDARTGDAVAQPMVHQALVNRVQFSPDGRRVLTASQDYTARIWKAEDGTPAGNAMRHAGQVNTAEFSPDGRRLVTAGQDGVARVWDSVSGDPVTPPLRHAEAVTVARFSPDSRRLVTVANDGSAQVWHAATGAPIGLPLPHEAQVNWAEFSPDGTRVVTACADGTARIWRAETGAPVTPPIAHGSAVAAARFSPDGRRLLSSDGDARLWLWDAAEGKSLAEPARLEAVGPIQLRPDGGLLAVAGADGSLRLLETTTLQPVASPMPHDGAMRSADFSPDGRRVAGTAGGACIWDVPLGRSPCPEWLGLLAEAIGGKALNQQSVLVESSQDATQLSEQVRQRLAKGDPTDDWVVWGRWLLASPLERTVSPHSGLTLADYVRRQEAAGGSSQRGSRLAVTAGDPTLLATLPRAAEAQPAQPAASADAPMGEPPGPVIYDGSLRNGWEDFSWCDADFGREGPGQAGQRPIAVRAGPWQALYLHHPLFSPGSFDRLSFWIHGGETEKKLIVQATVRGAAQPFLPISARAGAWTRIVLPLKALHADGEGGFDGFWIQDGLGKSQGEFYVDRIRLLSPADAVGEAEAPPPAPRPARASER